MGASLRDLLNRIPANIRREEARLAEELKERAVNYTPVGVTGQLREGFKRINNIVYNKTEYAAHVEYGHRTRGGHGFVEGKFMLKRACDEFELNHPEARIFR